MENDSLSRTGASALEGLKASDVVREIIDEANRPRRGPSSPERPSRDPIFQLSELVELHGSEFVDAAFYTLLRRAPDHNGRAHYISQLASGNRGKVEVLGDLRFSPEGRKIKAKIPGLTMRYAVLRAFRLPLIGWPIRRIVASMRWRREIRRDQDDLSRRFEEMNRSIQESSAEQGRRLGLLEAQASNAALLEQLRSLDAKVSELSVDNWAAPLLALSSRVSEYGRQINQIEQRSADGNAVAAFFLQLRREYGWDNDDPSEFAAKLVRILRKVVAQSDRSNELASQNKREVVDQSRRLGLLLSDVRKRLEHPIEMVEYDKLARDDDHRLDTLYVAFEDQFRGSRADIKSRQSVHFSTILASGAGGPDRPILDVGSGRGEWLELLKEKGLGATGIDSNSAMVEMCKALNLECVEDDAVSYLRKLQSNTVGAVTGFHIIEHMTFRDFVALIDESLRVLHSGGIVLFETPNPANVLVGSRWFYLDPTHRNPIPSETAVMVMEARGFVQLEVKNLHPMEKRFKGRDEELAAELDVLFHGPQDYAIIARKA